MSQSGGLGSSASRHVGQEDSSAHRTVLQHCLRLGYAAKQDHAGDRVLAGAEIGVVSKDQIKLSELRESNSTWVCEAAGANHES